jgi:hypothetical protein
MGEEPKPVARKAGVEASFVQITAAHGSTVVEVYGLTKEGEVFMYQWKGKRGWAPLSMVRVG